MDPIPRPDVFDTGEETDGSDESLDQLHRARDYGSALWAELDRVREYLYVLAGEGTPPAVLHDGHDWENWAEMLAQVSSALAGPTGDNGHGFSQARQVAQKHGMQVLREE